MRIAELVHLGCLTNVVCVQAPKCVLLGVDVAEITSVRNSDIGQSWW